MEEKLTKKEIINHLKDNGIDFDSKANKSVLEETLRAGLTKDIESGLEELISDETELLIDKYEASYKSKGRTFILGSYASIKDASKALDKVGANVRFIKHITK